jgi:hypothetical protein
MNSRKFTHDFDGHDSHTLFTPRNSGNVLYWRTFEAVYIELCGALDLSQD